jgi:hypothetical protein
MAPEVERLDDAHVSRPETRLARRLCAGDQKTAIGQASAEVLQVGSTVPIRGRSQDPRSTQALSPAGQRTDLTLEICGVEVSFTVVERELDDALIVDLSRHRCL